VALAAENYLHTTHRTVNWFRKTFEDGELTLTPPYQRQAVWTNLQKSYLIDTILNGLPIPELYMQDMSDEIGQEEHIIVDGQQRIRAVLDFITGNFSLDGSDVSASWRGRSFEELTADQKKSIYNYKFVVRVLPSELGDQEIRSVFSRINKNVVNLNDQELRNATYSGRFISTIQRLADSEPFWSTSGIFTANDHRRMLDHEFISELAVSFLHGLQNKKDKLDQYYRQYEEFFDREDELISAFSITISEIQRVMPNISSTRWKKRSDFYTLFNEFMDRRERFPLPVAEARALGARIEIFGSEVENVLRLDDDQTGQIDRNVVSYARNVSRAASDRANRIARSFAFSRYIFAEEPLHRMPEPRTEHAEASQTTGME
jgi:hypothetical protein